MSGKNRMLLHQSPRSSRTPVPQEAASLIMFAQWLIAAVEKIYENMKPKAAAGVFEELDMDILLEVVSRMKERKVAPILALMTPTRAKELTFELAPAVNTKVPPVAASVMVVLEPLVSAVVVASEAWVEVNVVGELLENTFWPLKSVVLPI